jgi:hypothetical protein
MFYELYKIKTTKKKKNKAEKNVGCLRKSSTIMGIAVEFCRTVQYDGI